MIGEKVEFNIIGGKQPIVTLTGIIRDKVNIPIVSGSGYCPMDNYVIEDKDGDLHYVNPLYVKKKIYEGH